MDCYTRGPVFLYADKYGAQYYEGDLCPLEEYNDLFVSFMTRQFITALKPMCENAFEGWVYEKPPWFVDALEIIIQHNESNKKHQESKSAEMNRQLQAKPLKPRGMH